jgi:Putative DNA-binding domain
MADADLGVLQRWMLSAVTTPGGVAEGARIGRERYGLAVADAVRGSNRLSAEARLDIYARGYLMRLLECLRAEFPILLALVGDQVFEMFATSYVWGRPPRSYSLYDLGAGFAAFLEDTKPPSGSESIEALPASLAKLERARAEVWRAGGLEKAPAHHATEAFSLMISGTPMFLPDSVRLLRLEFDFMDMIAASSRGERPEAPRAAETFYAIARSRYRVRTHVLQPWQFELMRACGERDASLQAACEHAARASGCEPAQLWAELLVWLPVALDAGMLTMAGRGVALR